jgi:hypothetical protein
LLGVHIDPDNGSRMFLLNIRELLPD